MHENGSSRMSDDPFFRSVGEDPAFDDVLEERRFQFIVKEGGDEIDVVFVFHAER